ncbi:hypothetical protein [Nesterenkonia populi]|uniref:hypothetical protein n=1 Tax=Nesterenkonia populi TaxID=1591087 RepID=UPI0011BEBDAD|nr:hypothetical protein [Nesterenkonia populi]
MSQNDDARVVQAALSAHRGLLRAVEQGHRRAASGIRRTPELRRGAAESIALAGAHTARSASYAQRASFVEELEHFPAAGLRALTGFDTRNLRVPSHIGFRALPVELRPKSTKPVSRAGQDEDGDPPSFFDIIYGTHRQN